MTAPHVVLVTDVRHGFDDGAATARAVAEASGARVTTVMLVDRGGRTSGAGWVRVPTPAAPVDLQTTRLRVLDETLAALGLRGRRLEAEGASGRDPRRLRVVAEVRALRRVRDQLAKAALPESGVLLALALLDTAATALTREVTAAAPTLVVACGPEALAAAVRSGTRFVYSPRARPDASDDRAAAVRERERTAQARAVAVVAPDADAGGWGSALRLAGLPVVSESAPDDLETPLPQLTATRLLVGPAGFAGQAWEWAAAARRELGVDAEVVTVEQDGLNFAADLRPTPAEWDDLAWQLAHVPRVLARTHVLSESVRPVLGLLNGSVLPGDLPALRRAGVRVAVVCHGSDIRDPRLHGALYEHAPFGSGFDDVASLQEIAERNGRILAGFSGPVFVSTPDLLDSVPHATWLPVVIGEENFTESPLVFSSSVPVVLHAPSNPRFKGTSFIEPVLQRLSDEGLIDYRRHGSTDPAQVPAVLREADVVIDHVVIGNYGVLAAQALAAGRVVLGHVHERVRRRVPREVPILETTPETVESVLRGVLADREGARAVAAQGPAFARELHDGRRSARVLAPFLRT